MKDYEKVYKDFWKRLLEKSDDIIDMDALKRELFDFYKLIDKVRTVYENVTGGAPCRSS